VIDKSFSFLFPFGSISSRSLARVEEIVFGDVSTGAQDDLAAALRTLLGA